MAEAFDPTLSIRVALNRKALADARHGASLARSSVVRVDLGGLEVGVAVELLERPPPLFTYSRG
jgi:hypothetical protein